MATSQLSEQMRQRLTSLLSDDRPESAWLMRQLRALRDGGLADACSKAVYLLAHISLPEVQAERLIEDLLRHRDEVTRALRRDPGLRVAAIDYLSNVKKLLANPTIVESSHLERTEKSAITDSLTRLYNRRYFTQALALEARRSHRYSLDLSLLMLDLDGFKQVNDDHGHPFGDRVLQRVARVICRAVRNADVACRYGGEEFAVILPETDRLGGYAVAERIRRRLARDLSGTPLDDRPVRLSVSGGIASYPVDGADPATLVARADEALYLAKSGGKNRISLHHAERRRAVRYPAKSTARVALARPRGGPVHRVRALDLSTRGVLLEVGLELVPPFPVELTFHGRDSSGRERSWTITGKVARVERRGPAGTIHAAVAFDRPLPDACLEQQAQHTRSFRAVTEARA